MAILHVSQGSMSGYVRCVDVRPRVEELVAVNVEEGREENGGDDVKNFEELVLARACLSATIGIVQSKAGSPKEWQTCPAEPAKWNQRRCS